MKEEGGRKSSTRPTSRQSKIASRQASRQQRERPSSDTTEKQVVLGGDVSSDEHKDGKEDNSVAEDFRFVINDLVIHEEHSVEESEMLAQSQLLSFKQKWAEPPGYGHTPTFDNYVEVAAKKDLEKAREAAEERYKMLNMMTSAKVVVPSETQARSALSTRGSHRNSSRPRSRAARIDRYPQSPKPTDVLSHTAANLKSLPLHAKVHQRLKEMHESGEILKVKDTYTMDGNSVPTDHRVITIPTVNLPPQYQIDEPLIFGDDEDDNNAENAKVKHKNNAPLPTAQQIERQKQLRVDKQVEKLMKSQKASSNEKPRPPELRNTGVGSLISRRMEYDKLTSKIGKKATVTSDDTDNNTHISNPSLAGSAENVLKIRSKNGPMFPSWH
jgi:hypothetical protein